MLEWDERANFVVFKGAGETSRRWLVEAGH